MSPGPQVVITGGIGSGKSTVIDCLSGLGWSVIKADQVGHEVLTNPEVVRAIASRWPAAAIEGVVSRSELADTVFGKPDQLFALEEITHPHIVGLVDTWIERASHPIAIEVGVFKLARADWGLLVVVHAPAPLRMERALERGMRAADVTARMAHQPTDSEMLVGAAIALDNQGTLSQLHTRVRRLARWLTT